MTDYYYQKLMDKTVLYNCTCMHKSWHCALKQKASNEWVESGTKKLNLQGDTKRNGCPDLYLDKMVLVRGHTYFNYFSA